MKKIFTIILVFISSIVYSQIDYNIYIGLTKKEIIESFKHDDFNYKFEKKMYVNIDSYGKFISDNNHYTWLVYYYKIRALFVFNKKNDKCDKYYLAINDIKNYWDYYDYYNDILSKSDKELTWIEKRHKYYIELIIRASNPNQMFIFVQNKKYIRH